MKLRVALLVAAVVAISSASVAQAAAPRIVIISGQPLEQQVVISDWGKIVTIVDSAGVAGARPAPRTQLADRPRLRFSMFWGPRWNEYLRSGKPAAALRPWQANQVGSFYPAWRGRPALLDLPWAGRRPRPLSPRALSALKRSGVPIRLT